MELILKKIKLELLNNVSSFGWSKLKFIAIGNKQNFTIFQNRI